VFSSFEAILLAIKGGARTLLLGRRELHHDQHGSGTRRSSRPRFQVAAAGTTAHSFKRQSRGPLESELPETYDSSRLVLMAVDPYHVHGYWELTLRDIRAARNQLDPFGRAEQNWVLRFYDVTCIEFDGSNAHGYFDVAVDLSARNWYVELWSADKTYFAELGAKLGSRFASACRSNFVVVPASDPRTMRLPKWQLESEPAVDDTVAEPASEVANLDSTANRAAPTLPGAPLSPPLRARTESGSTGAEERPGGNPVAAAGSGASGRAAAHVLSPRHSQSVSLSHRAGVASGGARLPSPVAAESGEASAE
jgi:hypothetical protein